MPARRSARNRRAYLKSFAHALSSLKCECTSTVVWDGAVVVVVCCGWWRIASSCYEYMYTWFECLANCLARKHIGMPGIKHTETQTRTEDRTDRLVEMRFITENINFIYEQHICWTSHLTHITRVRWHKKSRQSHRRTFDCTMNTMNAEVVRIRICVSCLRILWYEKTNCMHNVGIV